MRRRKGCCFPVEQHLLLETQSLGKKQIQSKRTNRCSAGFELGRGGVVTVKPAA